MSSTIPTVARKVSGVRVGKNGQYEPLWTLDFFIALVYNTLKRDFTLSSFPTRRES